MSSNKNQDQQGVLAESAAPAFDTPFRRLWESLLVWQTAVFVALVIIGLQAVGLVKFAFSRERPVHVIEVDRLGRYVYSGRVEPATDDRIVRFELSEFIIDLRTVYSDRRALYEARKRALVHVHSEAVRKFLDNNFRQNDPLEISKIRHREVRVHSLLKIGEGVWRIEWSEIDWSLASGQEVERSSWTGIVGVELGDFAGDSNPIGLSVESLEWTVITRG